MTQPTDAERRFHRAMLDIYTEAKKLGYNATRFIGMVSDRGGLETARALVCTDGGSDGFRALWERGRLDLTVERLVLEDEWRELFSPEERRAARKRLVEYGYTGQLPEE